MEVERTRAGHLLHRLAWAGIACILLISAFDIHQWRVEHWRVFDAAFADLANALFAQPLEPLWLYAVAFPFIAVNFGCHVQILRGKPAGLLWPLIVSALAIAVMPLIGSQGVIYRSVWADALSLIGFAIGGAMAAILYFKLDNGAPVTRTGAAQKD